MGILEKINSMDLDVLHRINHGMVSPILDTSMPIVTGIWPWLLLFALVMLGSWLRFRTSNVFIFVAVLLVCLGISDSLSSLLLKNLFGRLRPCYEIATIRLVSGYSCGGNLGLPSGHATNTMAAAFLTFLIFRKQWTYIGFLIAILVGFSRLYLGVHYPSDVLLGMTVGTAVAFSFYTLLKRTPSFSRFVDPNYITGQNPNKNKQPYPLGILHKK